MFRFLFASIVVVTCLFRSVEVSHAEESSDQENSGQKWKLSYTENVDGRSSKHTEELYDTREEAEASKKLCILANDGTKGLDPSAPTPYTNITIQLGDLTEEQSNFYEKAKDVYGLVAKFRELLQEVSEDFEKINKIIHAEDEFQSDPEAEKGDVLREYGETLKDAWNRVTELKKTLVEGTSGLLQRDVDQANKLIADLNRETDRYNSKDIPGKKGDLQKIDPVNFSPPGKFAIVRQDLNDPQGRYDRAISYNENSLRDAKKLANRMQKNERDPAVAYSVQSTGPDQVTYSPVLETNPDIEQFSIPDDSSRFNENEKSLMDRSAELRALLMASTAEAQLTSARIFKSTQDYTRANDDYRRELQVYDILNASANKDEFVQRLGVYSDAGSKLSLYDSQGQRIIPTATLGFNENAPKNGPKIDPKLFSPDGDRQRTTDEISKQRLYDDQGKRTETTRLVFDDNAPKNGPKIDPKLFLPDGSKQKPAVEQFRAKLVDQQARIEKWYGSIKYSNKTLDNRKQNVAQLKQKAADTQTRLVAFREKAAKAAREAERLRLYNAAQQEKYRQDLIKYQQDYAEYQRKLAEHQSYMAQQQQANNQYYEEDDDEDWDEDWDEGGGRDYIDPNGVLDDWDDDDWDDE